jgi:asparagine synthase (glutamine-hydrolysing)
MRRLNQGDQWRARRLRSQSHLHLASEVKAILASGRSRLSWTRITDQFLTFLWTPDPNTLFRGIKTVLPGHLLILKEGDLSIREWWDVSFDEIEEGKSDAWWQERTPETLDRVVELEMVADVPLGSFLRRD